MPCEERAKLLLAYSKATQVYWDAVHELDGGRGVLRKAEYANVYRRAERARAMFEAAREAFSLHALSHDCIREDRLA